MRACWSPAPCLQGMRRTYGPVERDHASALNLGNWDLSPMIAFPKL